MGVDTGNIGGYCGGMKKIKLTQGLCATVDDWAYEVLKHRSWCASFTQQGVYARSKLNGKMDSMHRIIIKAKRGEIVDHINGDTLDNRLDNLRIVTSSQNAMNSRGFIGSSIYKGVHYEPSRNKWRAMITKEGKRHRLGRFDTEVEAAEAYNNAAVKLFGPYAKINEVE